MQSIEYIKVTAKDKAEIPVVMCNIEDSGKKGIVLVCHGFGVHSGSYIEHAGRLWQGGYATVIFDQRGHGKPPEGAKNWQGTIPDYQCFIDDVESVTEAVKKMAPDIPIAIYGHSMGSNIVINTLLRLPPEQVSSYFCAILESPWLGLYDPPGLMKRFMIRLFDHIAPNKRHYRKMKQDEMSGNTEMDQGYVKDPYNHGFISMRMIAGIMRGCSYAMENAERLPVKSFIAYADNELVVDKKAILDFAAKAGDMVTVKEYTSKHSIYEDTSKEQYCRDIVAFLDSNL